MTRGGRVLLLALGLASTGRADVASDAREIARWLSREVADATAFNAAGTLQGPANVHNLPGFEIGVSGTGTSSTLDQDALRSLPTGIDTGAFDVASSVVIPLAMVHARIGLPAGWDAGAKFGRNDYSDANGQSSSDVTSNVYGVELRRRLLGEGATGVLLPDVAIGLAYDWSQGHLRRTEAYNGPATGGALAADTTWKSDWDTGGLTVRASVSKQFLIVTPYAGLAYTRLVGDATSQVDIVGSLNGGPATAWSAEAKEKAEEGLLILSGGAMIHFFPLLGLNLGGAWTTDHWGATAGLNFQFR